MISSSDDQPRQDKPWSRPGRGTYALTRLSGMLRPGISVYRPEAGKVQVENDCPVTTRDGTVLRVNVHRPPGVPRG
ncbi:hypothetical protein [Streptomyces sp. NPDC001809]